MNKDTSNRPRESTVRYISELATACDIDYNKFKDHNERMNFKYSTV